jgi:hypothetical protein
MALQMKRNFISKLLFCREQDRSAAMRGAAGFWLNWISTSEHAVTSPREFSMYENGRTIFPYKSKVNTFAVGEIV